MVETATSGAVSVAYFETVEECMSAYAELCEEYSQWDNGDGTEDTV
ncbi:MAG TPA: hypothetical protein VFQ06_00510 [Nitrospira sp.]|nr:hypothetical protein [Nitrospira sp.]